MTGMMLSPGRPKQGGEAAEFVFSILRAVRCGHHTGPILGLVFFFSSSPSCLVVLEGGERGISLENKCWSSDGEGTCMHFSISSRPHPPSQVVEPRVRTVHTFGRSVLRVAAINTDGTVSDDKFESAEAYPQDKSA